MNNFVIHIFVRYEIVRALNTQNPPILVVLSNFVFLLIENISRVLTMKTLIVTDLLNNKGDPPNASMIMIYVTYISKDMV